MVALPTVMRAPGLEVEPRQQGRIGDGAEGAVAFAPARAERAGGGSSATVAVERIGAVDRLDLDQRGLRRRRRAPWRAMVAAAETSPWACRNARSAGVRLALDQRERHDRRRE